MFITGPSVVKSVTREEIGFEALGGAEAHSQKSGVAHFVCPDEESTLVEVQRLLRFLPSNNANDPPRLAQALDAAVDL
jgi:propionyl-CoA carboxylase beta chain